MTAEPYVVLELRDTDHRPVLLHVYDNRWHALYNPGDDPSMETPYDRRRWWTFPDELSNSAISRGVHDEWLPWVEAAQEELRRTR